VGFVRKLLEPALGRCSPEEVHRKLFLPAADGADKDLRFHERELQCKEGASSAPCPLPALF
jgi:hypothetical protein